MGFGTLFTLKGLFVKEFCEWATVTFSCRNTEHLCRIARSASIVNKISERFFLRTQFQQIAKSIHYRWTLFKKLSPWDIAIEPSRRFQIVPIYGSKTSIFISSPVLFVDLWYDRCVFGKGSFVFWVISVLVNIGRRTTLWLDRTS